MIRFFLVCSLVAGLIELRSCKRFEPCALRDELINRHGLMKAEAYQLVCVASTRDGSLIDTSRENGELLGIFAISGKWWCGTEDAGKNCNIKCSDLLDDDIADDVKCAGKILNEHGLEGWGQTEETCSTLYKDLNNCPAHDDGATYTKCELANILLSNGVPSSEVASWVCIAEHESGFRTAKKTYSNGIASYGIFQIGDGRWCNTGNTINECDINCENLLDNDIENDIECVQTIYKISKEDGKNGFGNWPSYEKCKSYEVNISQCSSSVDRTSNHRLSDKTNLLLAVIVWLTFRTF